MLGKAQKTHNNILEQDFKTNSTLNTVGDDIKTFNSDSESIRSSMDKNLLPCFRHQLK